AAGNVGAEEPAVQARVRERGIVRAVVDEAPAKGLGEEALAGVKVQGRELDVIDLFVPRHVTSPFQFANAASRASANPDRSSQATAATLSATVAQNTSWNGCLTVLCRNSCCAISAPGQPHSRPTRCRVASGVRWCSRWAATLSPRYMRKASRLAAAYAPTRTSGSQPSTPAAATRSSTSVPSAARGTREGGRGTAIFWPAW